MSDRRALGHVWCWAMKETQAFECHGPSHDQGTISLAEPREQGVCILLEIVMLLHGLFDIPDTGQPLGECDKIAAAKGDLRPVLGFYDDVTFK